MTADLTRRPTTAQPGERISALFWGLAYGSGAETESREPEEVVKHLIAVINTLEGRRAYQGASAEAMSFLLRLESDAFYASPEQLRGGGNAKQSLVYSIGVLLFERLTGHHPFVESLSPIASRIARDRSRVIGKRELCHLPTELRRILSRALSPFADDRWTDVGEMRTQLETFLGRADTVMAPLPARRGLGSQPPMVAGSGASSRPTPLPPPAPGSADRPLYDAIRAQDRGPRSDTTTFWTPPPTSAPRRPTAPAAPAPRWLIGTAVATITSVAALAVYLAMSTGGGQAVSTAAAPAAVADEDRNEPVPPPAPEPTPAATVAIEVPAPPTEFDADLGGEAASAAARACFDDARLARGVQIDVSLRFSATAGVSDKVYFASGQKLSRAQLDCVEDALTGIAAGAAPDQHQLVTYTLWLRPDGARHRARLR